MQINLEIAWNFLTLLESNLSLVSGETLDHSDLGAVPHLYK